MISLLIVAGSPIERAGLESLLAGSDRFAIAGSTGPSMVQDMIERHQPDVVLMTPEPEDESLLTALLEEGPGPQQAVVVLADDPAGSWVQEALRAGIRGVLPRSAAVAEIAAAIEAAAAGLVVLHPEAIDSVMTAPQPRPVRRGGEQPLTPREIEVLRMLSEGLGNKEIAWRLEISEHTVKFHIASIFTKLGASSRTEAVTLGIRRGLVLV